MTFRTGRRALMRATAWLVVALGLAFQAGCAGSTAPTSRSAGKATVIVGHAIRMPGYEGYRRDVADPGKPVDNSIVAPFDSISFEMRRYDPVTREVLPGTLFNGGLDSKFSVRMNVKQALINEFQPAKAVLRGVLSLGLTAIDDVGVETMRYRAIQVDAGHWTLERFTTQQLSGYLNHVTHHMLASKQGRLRAGGYVFEVEPDEVVYIGDMTVEIPIRPVSGGDAITYHNAGWRMRIGFDPAAMAAGFDGADRYPAILNRPLTPVR
jgi:hypothetical protein